MRDIAHDLQLRILGSPQCLHELHLRQLHRALHTCSYMTSWTHLSLFDRTLSLQGLFSLSTALSALAEHNPTPWCRIAVGWQCPTSSCIIPSGQGDLVPVLYLHLRWCCPSCLERAQRPPLGQARARPSRLLTRQALLQAPQWPPHTCMGLRLLEPVLMV